MTDMHPDGEHQRGLDADYALEVWHRRKWIAVAVFLAVFAGLARGALSLPDLYRTSATVLVSRQQVSEAYVKTSVTSELETRIQTIHQQMMSRGELRDMVIQLGLFPEFAGDVPDWVIDRMRRDIVLDLKSVQGNYTRNTISFTLTYSGRDPQAVVLIANTLAQRYVEENTRSRTGQAARTAEFLKTQLADAKRQLDAHEQRASEFKLRHGGELPDQVLMTLSSLERVYTKLRLNAEQQTRVQELRAQIEKQLAESDGVAGLPAATAPAAGVGQLATLRQELVQLRRQFTEQHPDVIRAKAQIAAIERQNEIAANEPSAEPPSGGRPAVLPAPARASQALDDATVQLKSLKEEEAFLLRSIATYESRIENAPRFQQEYEQLASDYTSVKDRYAGLLKRYEEAQLSDNLEQSQNVEQFRILDAAIRPNGPAAPNRRQLLLLGLVASMALAFGAVVAAERLDTTFHRVDDLRAFVNVRTLATIHLIPTRAAARRRRHRFALLAVLFTLALGLIVGGAHYYASGNEQLLRLVARS